jgi:hypothetical protein
MSKTCQIVMLGIIKKSFVLRMGFCVENKPLRRYNGSNASEAGLFMSPKEINYVEEKVNYVENGPFTSKKDQLLVGGKKKVICAEIGSFVSKMDRLRRTWVVYVGKKSFV